MAEQRFVTNQPVSLEETLSCEFKEVKGSNPIRAIVNTVDEYVVAYLNSRLQGSIYWGIRDTDRTVVGVSLSFRQRDNLRKGITNKLTSIQPSIAPTAYQMRLHEVYEGLADGVLVPDLFVVQVIAPQVSTDDFYFTDGNEAFVKTPGGKKKLSGPELVSEILKRLTQKSESKQTGGRLVNTGSLGLSLAMKRVEMVASVLEGAQILWVDDKPGNILYERMTLKSLGIVVDVASSTDEAMSMLSMSKYDLVISDMERYGDNEAGLQLLREIRESGLRKPVIFYVGYVDRDRGTPPWAFGITGYPDELFHYIMDVLERERLR